MPVGAAYAEDAATEELLAATVEAAAEATIADGAPGGPPAGAEGQAGRAAAKAERPSTAVAAEVSVYIMIMFERVNRYKRNKEIDNKEKVCLRLRCLLQ